MTDEQQTELEWLRNKKETLRADLEQASWSLQNTLNQLRFSQGQVAEAQSVHSLLAAEGRATELRIEYLESVR